MSERKWVALNWSPLATNVLDAPGYDLCTPDGTPVEFRRDGMEFVMTFRGEIYRTPDNLQMSYWMNVNEIGGVKKQPVCDNCKKLAMYRVNGLCEECQPVTAPEAGQG